MFVDQNWVTKTHFYQHLYSCFTFCFYNIQFSCTCPSVLKKLKATLLVTIMSLCDAFSFLCNRNIVLLMSFTLFHNYIKVPESSSVMKGDNLGTGKRRLLVLTDRNIAIITGIGSLLFCVFCYCYWLNIQLYLWIQLMQRCIK